MGNQNLRIFNENEEPQKESISGGDAWKLALQIFSLPAVFLLLFSNPFRNKEHENEPPVLPPAVKKPAHNDTHNDTISLPSGHKPAKSALESLRNSTQQKRGETHGR